MEFIFKVIGNGIQNPNKETLDRLKRLMVSFEQMVNTTIPEVRVHLK